MELATRSDATRESDAHARLFSSGHDGTVFQIPYAFTPDLLDDLLRWCAEKKVSDLRLETDRKAVATIGGKNVRITERALGEGEIDGILRFMYGDHATGVMKAGYDIDTSREIRVQGPAYTSTLHRFRINVTAGRAPGGDGKQMVIRTIPHTPPSIADLGIEKGILDNIRPRQGLILITGPTGSGKSTLGASILRELVERPDGHENVLEYSRPLEFVFDEVEMPTSTLFQTEVGRHLRPHDDADGERALFAYGARNALRRKPTIISIGETRDLATMEGSLENASTGHLVYTTVHTNGVPSTLRRCLQFFPLNAREGAASDLMENLRMVVTQNLFDRKGGGKVALREFMVFDERTRSLFARQDPDRWPTLARNLLIERRVTGQLMREAAWTAFESGLITRATFGEIVRSEEQGA